MNLAIDIGNTSIKCGLFDGNILKENYSDEVAIRDIFSTHKVGKVIISKSGHNESIQDFLRERGIPVLMLSYLLKSPVKNLYKSPATLGADRIAGSVAANALYPNQPVLKMDFGTCITYDIIDGENQYHGGSISPGLTMRFKALNHYTAQLPVVDPHKFSSFDLIGTDTSTSILSGVVNGITEEVNGIIKQYESRFGSLKVVATGGDVSFFGALLKNEIFVRPNLVLEGLNTILNYNT